GSNDVNTPTVNLEKLLEPNIGAHINDTTSVEVSATSNLTPITSASMPESISFAGKLKGDLTRKSVNFLNLVTSARNEANVDISLESIRVISDRFANTAYGFFLGKWVACPVVANYVRNIWSKYGRVKSMLNSSNGLFFFQISYKNGLDAMLENDPWSSYADLRADGELKDTIVVAMPKLTDEGFNYPRQATRGATVGPKVSFKLTKQIYIPISNKNDVSARCKKKQAEVSREKVSNSNLFDALNYVEDDDELGTNGRNSKSVGKGSLNVAHG
nr:hypothetical protein [Tanacetum cinerariifolium]